MNKVFTKAILLIVLITFFNTDIKAQYVTIPDANFVSWLTTTYPTCMNGNDMDTTCSDIITETIISIAGNNISDLTGIEYFSNLLQLDCSSNLLTILPPVASSIKTLYCNINQLISLPNLPDSLDLFDCSENNLTYIPPLPSKLAVFNCTQNQLSNLPALPGMIQYLYCSNNNLAQLPTLPDSLLDFSCSYNQLTVLPDLPQTLQILLCRNNVLTSLPTLPVALQTLVCSSNQLTILPDFPQSLVILECDSNQLMSIPALPPLVAALNCNNNQLTSLPVLTQLQWLNCSNNNISCFPEFPSSFGPPSPNFNISNNPATCLPNYISAMSPAVLAMPLCTIGNVSGCDGSAEIGIIGKVYTDTNSNCEFDSTDNVIKNIQLTFYNSLTAEYGFTSSSTNGVYTIAKDTGTYSISVDTTNKPFISNCIYPGNDSIVVLTSAIPLAGNVNFDIICKANLDLNVQSINHQNGLIFPGQQHTLQVMTGDASQWYGLNCASGSSGQVQITVSGPVSYDGIATGALNPVVNGNLFTYSISDFGLINNLTDFGLLFTTDTTAQNGDQICVHAEVIPIVGDINPSNNSMDYCYSVVNSYDPNYKEVNPGEVLPGYQDWLTFTIHFQNLGTAPAFNIRLLDSLDINLNEETFEVINYSHANTVTLFNRVLNFRFPNIMLPDSASNPAGSEAYVQYRIKPKANLIAGTKIENTAYIYFDYNLAVITNTTINNFANPVSSSFTLANTQIKVYPNPGQGIFIIDGLSSDENYTFLVSDIRGKILKKLIVHNLSQKQIEMNEFANGIYTLTISGNKSKSYHKLIIVE